MRRQGAGGRLRRLAPLLLPVLLCLPALAPLFRPGFIAGQDGLEHVFRVLTVATAWQQAGVLGDLLPRWAPDLALGYGYPLFGVYSPLAYALPAALMLLGLPALVAVKVAIGLALLAGGLGAYACLRAIAGPAAATVAAVTFVYAPYTLANAYVRVDLAELSAMCWAAPALAALLALLRDGDSRRRVALAAVALAALPLLHNLSAFVFAPTFALVAAGLLVAVVRGGWSRAWPLLAAPLLAAGLAAFFLLPAWRWQAATRLAAIPQDAAFFAKLLDPVGLWQRHFAVAGWGWFAPGSGWWSFSVAPGPLGEFGAGPSTLAWLALPVAPAVTWRRPRLRPLALALAASCAVSAALLTRLALPFWQAAAHLSLLQFPWRFAGPLCLDTALLLGLALAALPPVWRRCLAALAVALAVIPALVYLRPLALALPPDAITWPVQWRRELVGGYGTTGIGLFLPRWAEGRSPDAPALPPAAPGAVELRIVSLAGRDDAFVMRYVAPASVTLTLGAWYFPGWWARVDGQATTTAPGAGGLLAVTLPAGTHTLALARAPTGSEWLGGLVSLAALAVLLGLPARHGGLGVGLVCGALCLAAVAGFTAAQRLPEGRLGPAPAWQRAPVLAGAGPVTPVAWRVTQSAFWGAQPALEVTWLAGRAPVGDNTVTVRVLAADGRTLAEVQRRPRLGTAMTTDWPAGMLVLDQVLVPLPPPGSDGRCAGAYRVALGMGPAGAVARLAELGTLPLPCRTAAASAVTQVSAPRLSGLGAGRLPTLRPGGSLGLDVTLQAAGPTVADDTLALQVLGADGTPVAEADSYGNVDLHFSSLWQPGERVAYRLQAALPVGLSPGVYHVGLRLFAPGGDSTALAGPAGPVGSVVDLGPVKVAAPVAEHLPVAERFGDSIGLVRPGASLPRLDGRAGEAVTVPLRWLALAPPPADDTVFVHVVDAAGRLVAQADAPPLDGRYPTSAWDRGEVIDDPRTLNLPAGLPAGRYRVLCGWYLPAGGARLPVTPPAADNAVVVAEVQVAP